MNPTKDLCVAVAEQYDIDWYTGEFASVFWNRHDNTDAQTLQRLQAAHKSSETAGLSWGHARSRIVATLEEIQGRSPSTAGDPSWLRNDPETSATTTRGNVAWLSANDASMSQAIRAAQTAFLEFTRTLDTTRFEESLVKAYFAHPADPSVGEHIFLDAPEVLGTTIKGTLWFEATQIPGLESGQTRSVDVTRLSDWFFVVDGTAHGGYSLPVIAATMDAAGLAEAKQHPPFSWFTGKF